MPYTCKCCGKTFNELPSLGFLKPNYWHCAGEEAAKRGILTDDYCEIDGYFYVRAVLPIPLIDSTEEDFQFGVWVSQSEASIKSIGEFEQGNIPSLQTFGWLDSNLKDAGFDTVSEHIPCDVVFTNPTLRPTVNLKDIDHPLRRAQVEGISIDMVLGWLH